MVRDFAVEKMLVSMVLFSSLRACLRGWCCAPGSGPRWRFRHWAQILRVDGLRQCEVCCHVPFLAIFARRPVQIWVVVRWDGNSKRGAGQNRPLRLAVSRALLSHGIGGGPSWPEAGCRPEDPSTK